MELMSSGVKKGKKKRPFLKNATRASDAETEPRSAGLVSASHSSSTLAFDPALILDSTIWLELQYEYGEYASTELISKFLLASNWIQWLLMKLAREETRSAPSFDVIKLLEAQAGARIALGRRGWALGPSSC